MKKLLTLFVTFLLVLTMAFSAIGCGGNGGDDPGPAPSGGDLPVDTVSEIDVLIGNDQSEQRTMDALAAEFNKTYTKIKITVIQTSNAMDYLRNDSADIVHIIGENVDSYATRNFIEDLNPYITSSNFDTSKYYTSMIDLGKYSKDGHVYMMARDYSRMICFYNKTLFTECGVDYPTDDWTWEQFLSTCEALKNSGHLGTGYTVLDNTPSYDILNWGILCSYGLGKGSLLTDDYYLVSDTSDTYTQWSQGMATAKNLVTAGYASRSSAYVPQFAQGKSALNISATPTILSLKLYELDYDVVSFPAIGSNPKAPAGTSGYSIAKNAQHKAAAWQFIKFIMSEDGQKVIGAQGMVPVLKSLAEDTTAAWRNMTNGKGAQINVNALISHSERDVVADWFGTLPADAKASFTGLYKNFLTTVCDGDKTFRNAYNVMKQGIEDIHSDFPEYFDN